MKKALSLFLCTSLMLFCLTFKAQTLDVKWSDPMIKDKTGGTFNSYIDLNSKYIYTLFTGKSKLIKIVAYDKNTFKQMTDRVICDSKIANSKEFEDLRYYKTLVFENTLYVFWYKENKKVEELYVQSFDSNLKPMNGLKKVYEVISEKGDDKKGETFVMGNKKAGEKVVIGAELSSDKGESVKIEYKVLDSKFNFLAAKQVTLPIVVNGKSNKLTSSYVLGDDGNLHIKSRVAMSKEERKNLKQGESSSYSIYSMINLSSGNIKSYTMKFDNKNIFDFDFLEDATTIKLFGFFCDLKKDKDGNDIHGVFYAIIDPKTYKLVGDFKFTYFTKTQIDDIFSKSYIGGKDRAGIFASKKDKKSEQESIASDYSIEQVQSIDKDNIVLFCSVMDNYSYQQCTTNSNGVTTCRTVYRCRKSNVTAIKIKKDGQIDWASNIDRQEDHPGLNVKDLQVMNKDGKFYAIYSSRFEESKKDETGKTTKMKRKDLDSYSDELEYAVFDYKTGKYEKKKYIINKPGVSKKEKKKLKATQVEVIDNNFYSYSIRSKAEVAPCFCFGVFYKKPPLYLAKFNVIK